MSHFKLCPVRSEPEGNRRGVEIHRLLDVIALPRHTASPKSSRRCRAKLAHIGRSKSDSSLSFQTNVLEIVPCWLESGGESQGCRVPSPPSHDRTAETHSIINIVTPLPLPRAHVALHQKTRSPWSTLSPLCKSAVITPPPLGRTLAITLCALHKKCRAKSAHV